ncbi:MAG: transcriptional regulator GcvA [Pseudomonadota bacterium]
MNRRLPPLTSLRAFEAAGRHLSFTRAAEELTVTQAAISHQVKSLEEHLGLRLFVRMPRRLELTAAGKKLLPVVRDSFSRISDSIAKLSDIMPSPGLTVRLTPSFSAKWLSPRLDAFRQRHPDIDLSLNHSNAPVDFARESIDVAVTYGNGKWPRVIADPVMSLDFFPVCSPVYLASSQPLEHPNDLQRHTLLHDSSHENWAAWLELAEVDPSIASRGPILDDTNVLTQAAIDGLGVALGSTSFIADHLESGRLVRLFDIDLHNEYAYYVVCPRSHLRRPSVVAFRDWLLEQSEVGRALLD